MKPPNVQPFSCKHGEQYISKKYYKITVVLLVLLWRRFMFPDLIYKDGPLNFMFYFLKYIVGILDWGLAYSFWDHVILILFRLMNLQVVYSQLWKVSFLETFTSENEILIIKEQLHIFNIQTYNVMKCQLINCLLTLPASPLKRRAEKPAHLLS